MQLTRCKDQRSDTLEEFYKKLNKHDNSAWRESGKTMLNLLTRLRALPNKHCVWGLTSHSRLCLLSQDSYQSPWYVIIATLDTRNYFIEYLLPERLAPWLGAYVKGEARSEDEAVSM